MLERCISEDSNWIVPSDLSIADIAIWRVLGWLTSGIVDGLPTNILADFPRTKQLCLAVDKQPKIQEWISLTYPTNYARGNY
jgi:glutathione S-transferase